jgi:peptide/nickel transport system substrate-binding protein
VRQALAHAVDKHSLTETVYHGEEPISDFMLFPTSRWGAAAESTIVRYPYDLRRSEQLMAEAGFIRGPDGIFGGAAAGRFRAELKTTSAPNWEAEMTIMAAEWRKAGFEIQDAVLPQAQAQDAELRMTFPAMFTSTTSLGERAMLLYSVAEIPRADNRWRGGNRGAWVNPEYDRLLDAFATTLDPTERASQVAQMARIFTDDVPVISLLFNSLPAAHVSALKGPMRTAPEALLAWNVHEWELR